MKNQAITLIGALRGHSLPPAAEAARADLEKALEGQVADEAPEVEETEETEAGPEGEEEKPAKKKKKA